MDDRLCQPQRELLPKADLKRAEMKEKRNQGNDFDAESAVKQNVNLRK